MGYLFFLFSCHKSRIWFYWCYLATPCISVTASYTHSYLSVCIFLSCVFFFFVWFLKKNRVGVEKSKLFWFPWTYFELLFLIYLHHILYTRACHKFEEWHSPASTPKKKQCNVLSWYLQNNSHIELTLYLNSERLLRININSITCRR